MPSTTAITDSLRRFLPARWRKTSPRVAVLRLSGAIGAVSPIRPGLSIGSLATSLEQAFTMKRICAVALIVNSPGGSAAQSHLIYRRIRALAAEKKLPVFAFVEDAAASGGYMIACAADEIIADPASLVGSIGVVSAGFGFDKLIERIGVERRVHTQGEAKAMLDPFRPEDPADVERLKVIQADIQDLFTRLVTERRPKLAAGQNLFTGAVWSGRQALELGARRCGRRPAYHPAGALRRKGRTQARRRGQGLARRTASAEGRPRQHRGRPSRCLDRGDRRARRLGALRSLEPYSTRWHRVEYGSQSSCDAPSFDQPASTWSESALVSAPR